MTPEAVDLPSVQQAPAAPASRRSRRAEDVRPGRWWRDSRRRRYLATADIAAGLFAILVSPIAAPAWLLAGAVPILVVGAKLAGLYDLDHRRVRHLTVDELGPLAAWALGSMLTIGLIAGALSGAGASVGPLLIATAAAIGFSVILRSLARRVWRGRTPAERTIVIGDGRLRGVIERKIELFPDMHLDLVDALGWRESGTDPRRALEIRRQERLAQHELEEGGHVGPDFEALASRVDRLIVAHDVIDPAVVGELVGTCRERQVKLSVVSPLSGRAQPPAMIRIAELPVMEYDTSDVSWSTALLKRFMDIVLSTVGLVLASPVLLVTALAVKLDSRGPVLFVQRRAGHHGRPFGMLKFRSMDRDAEARLAEVVSVHELEEPAFKLEADPRVTRVGRWIRKTSLDEIPQLWNVLRGDMSIVGPRPEEVQVVERYRPEHRFRLDVRPGLTGPMQVFGRGALTFPERLAVELDYVENASFGRDMRILVLTLPAVFRGNGAF